MSTRADPRRGSIFDQRFASALSRLPRASRYWVAYSGGLDSTVLLHALVAAGSPPGTRLHAVHVNHGLNPAASEWAERCRAWCARRGVAFTLLEVEAAAGAGDGPEAAARRARYGAITDLIRAGDCLLTAHHRDDQAETVLLQLLRGCGPRGLAAMPEVVRFAAGWHARPLLDMSRAELRDYALGEGLEWIEDPSNRETGLRRNYLRHEVMPRLQAQWPGAAASLVRSAAHCAEAAGLLEELAQLDLEHAAGPRPETLCLAALRGLAPARQRNLLRAWVRRQDLPVPAVVHLERLQADLLNAPDDATPVLRWPGAELRRYRDLLYLMPPLAPHDPSRRLPWPDGASALALPGGGRLSAHPCRGAGIAASQWRAARVTVRFRRGGERCRPGPAARTRALKKLLQEWAVPPWRRERLPLVYLDGELAAVADRCVCHPFQAGPEEEGVRLEWVPGGEA